MYMRIIVSLFFVSTWYLKGSDGLGQCSSNANVIHACKNNSASNLYYVYVNVSTLEAPKQQAIECTCLITSSVLSESYTLTVQGAGVYNDDNTTFLFSFNNATIRDNTDFDALSNVNLTGETVLKYASPNKNTVQVCLYIAAITDKDKFNIICMENQINQSTEKTTIPTTRTSKTESGSTSVTTQTSKKDSPLNTEQTTSSTSNISLVTSDSNSNTETTRSTETTSVSTEPQTNNNPNEDNIILFAASGGGGGVALIIIIVTIIVCCKRKRKSPQNEATPVEDTRPASFCNGSDDDDYGMVLNPSYQPFHEVLPNQPPPKTDTVETNLTTGETSTSAPVYATPLKRKVSQDIANGITTTVPSNDNTKKGATCQSGDADNPASHYDYTIHQAAQVVTSDIDDTYDHTFSSTSGKWTGNEYNRVPMRRHDEQNVPDNDTYNVLKL